MKRRVKYATKLKDASHLLFFKHHRKPGVKGWELKKNLGLGYPKVIALLNSYLEKLDLQVKTVFENGAPSDKPTITQLDKARFYITLRRGVISKEARMMGWRIDDIAGLSLIISLIIARKGKVSIKEVRKLLQDKLPGWRININIERYIREGYIDKDDNGNLYLDWRTRAEVEEDVLIKLLIRGNNGNLQQEYDTHD